MFLWIQRLLKWLTLFAQASSVIVAHNLPSENIILIVTELQVTRRLVEDGKMLDLPLADHLSETDNK